MGYLNWARLVGFQSPIFWTLVFTVFLLALSSVEGDCRCSFDDADPYSQSCSGDLDRFFGTNIQLFTGNWATCDKVIFSCDDLVLLDYQAMNQSIEVPDGGLFLVEGNFFTPSAGALVVNAGGPGTTLQVVGNFTVNGDLQLVVDILVINGSLRVNHGASAVISVGTSATIQGNIENFGGTLKVNNVVDGDLSLLLLGGSVYDSGELELSQITAQVNGSITVGGKLTVDSFAVTTISLLRSSGSVSVASIDLVMSPLDKSLMFTGSKKHKIISGTQSNMSSTVLSFIQDWTCGNLSASVNINQTEGLEVSIIPPKLPSNVNYSDDYCCLHDIEWCACRRLRLNLPPNFSLAPDCIIPCTQWICDRTGVIIGWVIGVILGASMLGTSCFLCVHEFIQLE